MIVGMVLKQLPIQNAAADSVADSKTKVRNGNRQLVELLFCRFELLFLNRQLNQQLQSKTATVGCQKIASSILETKLAVVSIMYPVHK